MFLSSHLMSEMALVADHLIIVGRGRILADTTVAGPGPRRRRGTPSLSWAAAHAPRASATSWPGPASRRGLGAVGMLQVDRACRPREIGDPGRAHGIALYELTGQGGLPRGCLHGTDQGTPSSTTPLRGQTDDHNHRQPASGPLRPPLVRSGLRSGGGSRAEWAKLVVAALDPMDHTLGRGCYLLAFGTIIAALQVQSPERRRRPSR